MKTTNHDKDIIYFTPRHLWQYLVRKIIDYRITNTATVDVIGKGSESLITIIYYAKWQKAIYFLGWRIK